MKLVWSNSWNCQQAGKRETSTYDCLCLKPCFSSVQAFPELRPLVACAHPGESLYSARLAVEEANWQPRVVSRNLACVYLWLVGNWKSDLQLPIMQRPVSLVRLSLRDAPLRATGCGLLCGKQRHQVPKRGTALAYIGDGVTVSLSFFFLFTLFIDILRQFSQNHSFNHYQINVNIKY